MTIKEYVEIHQMTRKSLANLVGCSESMISQLVNHDVPVRKKSTLKKLRELGIEVKEYERPKKYKEKKEQDYLFTEKVQIQQEILGNIYCYSSYKLDQVKELLNKRKICYYVIHQKDYWAVKYDKTIEEEEWVQ